MPSLRSRVAIAAAAALVSLAVFAGACGSDDDEPAQPSPTSPPAGGSVPSTGSVAPNTFLTFEGAQYRLVELLQADLVDDSAFEEVGEATAIDIDQEDLTVYRRAGDGSAVYTFSPGTESEVVGEGIPALWYRWSPEP